MPQPGTALEKLGFLTIGLFDGQNPGPGHQVTLEMIELGERLGFDSAWLRHRHLQYGISSPVAVMAAASQRTSPAQREKYAAYVAARTPRTAAPVGPARMMFARDILGTSEEIVEALYAHAAFREVSEVAFALPFTFAHEDYVQILTDMATRLGPLLGWSAKG